jgi:hemerythrin-like metal-binding protein/PAS domain S-box-containing protein|tara:strand:- start:165 stop:2498 length:2334 start_codon:yes stop_codon:yes gene_type:complete
VNKQNRPASKPDTESLTAVIAGLDSMRHGLCLVDSNFILIVANKAFADLLELPPDLIRPGSTTVEEIFRYIAEQDEYGPGNKDEQVAERMRQARLNSPSRFERVRPDGRVIEVVRTPVAGGGFISIFTDVTEKYRAEKALETSEASLAEAQKTTHIGSWGHGFGDMLYHWSDETSRILGYEPGKVAPSYDNYFQRIHPDDRDAMIRQFAAAKETRRDYRIDYRVCRPSGEIRQVCERGKFHFSADGAIQSVVGTLQDITEQKAVEEQLRASEERFRGAFNSSHGIATISDLDTGRYVDVNQAWLTNRGYRRDEVIGKTSQQLNIWGSKEARRKLLADLAVEGRLLNYETFSLTKSGEPRDMSINAHVIEVSGEKLLFISGSDITERRRAETQLINAKEEAERSNQAKSEFLASMSHELRTPLNAVLGFAQLLQSNPQQPLSPIQHQHVQSILDGGDHLLQLVNEILDLSEIEADRAPLKVETVNANALIAHCVEQLSPLGDDRQIKIENHLGDEPRIDLSTDPFRFKQVLINLLSNAIKYNRFGGAVTIKGHPTKLGYFHLSVTDNGKGIKEKDQSAVFQLFHRLGTAVTVAKEGSGIGLYVAKLLVKRMAGQIGFESELGSGSTFWIELPLATNQEALIWDDRLRTGIDALDKDHQILVSLLNQVSHLSADRENLGDPIGELIDYARYHFQREKTIMEICRYPHLAREIDDFKEFERRINALSVGWNKTPDAPRLCRLRRVLRDWLFSHITADNAELADCAQGKEQEIRNALNHLQ